jgi:hypothetical protein
MFSPAAANRSAAMPRPTTEAFEPRALMLSRNVRSRPDATARTDDEALPFRQILRPNQ